MNNRMQGEEDVGFNNELTPEQIREILAISQKNGVQIPYDQDVQNALSKMPKYPQDDILQKLNRNPANMGESADLKQIMGMSGRPMPSATPMPSPQEKFGTLGMVQQFPSFKGFPINPPSNDDKYLKPPMEQEDISAEDMEALKKILMNQGQGQMPSPTPSPSASPFRNIRGTIDRSK